MAQPYLVDPHVHVIDARRLVSLRFTTQPGLKELFPQGVPESYMLDKTREGAVAGGHRHARKNEVFCCVEGCLKVVLRWVDDGVSYHADVVLNGSDQDCLVIPAGVWHEVQFLYGGSILNVWSSTVHEDDNPDATRELPGGYVAIQSRYVEVR